MSKADVGKRFEVQFKKDWTNQFPNTWCFRLKDQMSGYKEVSGNPCDFLCYPGNRLYMVECKEHKGNSIPFTAIPQYERLLEHKNKTNVSPGCIIWFSEKDTVVWVSIYNMERMVLDGEKSIGLRMLTQDNNKYNIVILPSVKKRVMMETDYSILLNLKDGE